MSHAARDASTDHAHWYERLHGLRVCRCCGTDRTSIHRVATSRSPMLLDARLVSETSQDPRHGGTTGGQRPSTIQPVSGIASSTAHDPSGIAGQHGDRRGW
jgi:hypothetical protein